MCNFPQCSLPQRYREKRLSQIGEKVNAKNPLVGILSGSSSDKPIVDKVTGILDNLEIPWEFNILSAHRTPDKCANYVKKAEGRGLKVLIGIAGLAAALPGAGLPVALGGHPLPGARR